MQQKNLQKIKNSSGFVILFAVTISSILLAIALGVTNIALKEIKFGTSARDTNEAFFAADTGIESVLFMDKPPSAIFVPAVGEEETRSYVVSGLGNANPPVSCAKVTVTKDNTSPPFIITTVISRGYNSGDASCDPLGSYRIERELRVSY